VNLLVIGGAGYIGAHVVKALLEEGHHVTVFDNLSSGRRKNLFDQAHFIRGDILDAPFLSEVLNGGFEAVFHFAAFKAAGESMAAPETYAVNNICGTINILNAMSQAGVKHLIFSSTAAVYGTPGYLPLDENHPLDPDNFYGFTKLEIERLLAWYDRLKGLRYAALRYFNAAGYDTTGAVTGLETNPANLLPVIMETACGMRQELVIFGDNYDTPDGTCIRDYIHVSDLAEAHCRALDYLLEKQLSLTLNLGTGKGHSVLEVYRKALEITGVDIPMRMGGARAGDPARLYAGGERARKELGFTPIRSDLESQIKSMWQVYRKNR
jgi:UDP-glucose 4-epimerase